MLGAVEVGVGEQEAEEVVQEVAGPAGHRRRHAGHQSADDDDDHDHDVDDDWVQEQMTIMIMIITVFRC